MVETKIILEDVILLLSVSIYNDNEGSGLPTSERGIAVAKCPGVSLAYFLSPLTTRNNDMTHAKMSKTYANL